MRTVIQIVSKYFWWILLLILIIVAVFIRPSILGFKKGMNKITPTVEMMKSGKNATAMMQPPKKTNLLSW